MATGLLRRVALAPSVPTVEPVVCSLSFEQVYAAHFKFVWRALRGLGVAEHCVEDAAHDVFLVVQRKLSEFDGQSAQLTTWLYEIALRVGRRYRAQVSKQAQRQVSLAPPCEESDADVAAIACGALDSHAELERSEQLALAHRALARLDDEKREAFVLACVEQRSASEIARITGVPLNTVYSRVRAARRLFADAIARLEPARARRAR